MAKTMKQLEQELADALAARDVAEQKAQQAEIEKAEALKEKEAAKQEAKAPVTGDHSFAGITLLASMLCLAAGTIVFVKRKHI